MNNLKVFHVSEGNCGYRAVTEIQGLNREAATLSETRVALIVLILERISQCFW